jgi:regulator of cell morphogenesis and NO signaling
MNIDIPRDAAPTPRIDASLTVNEVLRSHPRTVAVFNALAIDACCGGERSLARAAQEDDVSLDALLAALRWAADDDEEEPR